MATENHMLQAHSLFEKAGEVFEGVAKLKERIAELEAERNTLKKSLNEKTEAFAQSQRALWLSRARAAEAGRRFWVAMREGRRYDAEKAWKMEKRRERQVDVFKAKAEEYK